MTKPSGPPRPDRRPRRTQAALQRALLDLVEERAYETVTVEDVLAAADVARATFYTHYRDKEDLLVAVTQQVVDELTRALAAAAWQEPPTFSGEGIRTILGHVEHRPALYALLVSGNGGARPRAVLVTALMRAAEQRWEPAVTARGTTPRVPVRLVTVAFVGALLHTVEQWLAGTIDGDSEALAADLMQTVASGVGWAFGFEPDEVAYAVESQA